MAGYEFTSEQLEKLEADNRALLGLQAKNVKPIKLGRPGADLRAEAEAVALGLLEDNSQLAEQIFATAFRTAQVMALQPGSTKNKNGKTYTLNENHRWTVEKDSPGQKSLFDVPKTQPGHYENLQKQIKEAHSMTGEERKPLPADSFDLIRQHPLDKQTKQLKKTYPGLSSRFDIHSSTIGSVLTFKNLPELHADYYENKDINGKQAKRFVYDLKQYAQKIDHKIEINATTEEQKQFWESQGFTELENSKAHWSNTHEYDPASRDMFVGTSFLPDEWKKVAKPQSEPRQFPLPLKSKDWHFYLNKHDITPEQIQTALKQIIPLLEIDGLETYEKLKSEAENQEDYSRFKILKSAETKALRNYLEESGDKELRLKGRYGWGRNGLTESAGKLTLFHNFLRVLGGKKPLDKKALDKIKDDALEQLDDTHAEKRGPIPAHLDYDDFYLLLRHKFAELDNQAIAMSLQPGARKTENGREYVLNQNSRWERSDKAQGQKRATTRDEVGENGELYQPGQFISTVDRPKKKRDARIAGDREKKQETAPYTWEKPPSAYHTSIFARYAGTALARSGDELIVYEPFKAKNPELDWDAIQALADKYNQGDRWFQTEQNLADQAEDEAAIDSTRVYEVDVLESASGEKTYRPAFEPRDFIPYKLQPNTKNSDYVGKPGTPSKNAVPDIEFIRNRGGKLTAPTKAGADYLPPEVAESGAIATDDLPVGQRVNYRIDIPTFNQTGKYVGTLHVPGTRVAAVIGYTPVVRMKNVKFMNNELTALKIMEGADKTTVAAVEGEIVPFEMPSDEELNRDWIPVGYNPVHSVFYYDKRTGQEVRIGDESLNIGNTIFVKKPVYGDRDTEKNPYDARYTSIRGDETKNVTDKAMQSFLNQLNQDKLKRVKKRESEGEHNLRMALQPGMTKSAQGKTYELNQNHRWELKQTGLFGEIHKSTKKPTSPRKNNPPLAAPTVQPVPQVPSDVKKSGPGWVDYSEKKELAQWFLREKLKTLNMLAADGKLEKIEGGRDPRILVHRRLKFGRPADMRREMLSPVYLSGSWSASVSKVAKAQGQQIGMLITPDTKNNAKHLNIDVADGSPEFIAVDNGVFGGNFDSRKFLALLDDLADKQVQGMTLFVTAPDSFDRASMTGNAEETIKNFPAWSKEIRQRGFPAAMVAQDGLENEIENIPWDDLDVLFIGGSDEFKLGKYQGTQKEAWEKIWSEARKRGVPVHVGRVNSLTRLKFAESREFDSADGNFIMHGPDINAPKVGAWLEKLRQKEAMDRSTQNRNQGKILDSSGLPIAMALQPGQTKSVKGKTYVLNQNHRWTLRKQGGLFGDDFEPGKWTPEEHEKLTGEKKGKGKAPKEHQNEMFDRGKKDDLPGQNLLFEDEDGVERKPSESERSLAASDGDTAYHRKARKVVARHYLATKATFLDFKTQEMKPLDPARVTGMMDGIDLSKPVVVGPPPSVPPPEQMAQWQAPGGNRGGYFSTVDAIPSDLGIGELATAWGLPGKPVLKRERKLYSLAQNPNAHYMRSTAKETTDTWGAEGMKQEAKGGGIQWFFPEAADPGTRIREF